MRRWWITVLAMLAVGCSGQKHEAGGAAPVEVWFHTGQPGEQRTIEGQVARFNASQNEVAVHLTLLPEGGYNAQVQAAAAAGDLPDLLEVDGPFLYRYVWQEVVRPLDGLLPEANVADLLPSIRAQGTYQGFLYGVGTFDSGLGLWGDRRRLAAADASIPDGPEHAWTVDAFDRILDRLAADDADGAVLDLKLNYPGEWYTYAFSPVLQSAGADLVDRASGEAARRHRFGCRRGRPDTGAGLDPTRAGGPEPRRRGVHLRPGRPLLGRPLGVPALPCGPRR